MLMTLLIIFSLYLPYSKVQPANPVGIIQGLSRIASGKNFHAVESGKLYRSNQLSASKIGRYIDELGIKTVINLRGAAHTEKWWQEEEEAVTKHGAVFHNICMSAQVLPQREQIHELLHLYDTAAQPILIHCNGGADRTGEAAALWKLYKQKASTKEALKQLSARFGHFSWLHPAKRFFIKLWKGEKWLEEQYDPYHYPHLMNVKSIRSRSTQNFHVVDNNNLYRSAQLAPKELINICKKHAIKTVVNLIGERPYDRWWQEEQRILKKKNIAFFNVALSTDYTPYADQLQKLLRIYTAAEKPILIHCREGADRTGEAAALWQLHMRKTSIPTALEQLSFKYYHNAWLHPAKRYFISHWKGSEWALSQYDPSQLPLYQHPNVIAKPETVS